MSQLETLFRQTFEDEIFTRAERKMMREAVKTESPSPQALGALRAKVFEMVAEQLPDPRSQRLLEWLREANKVLLPKAAQGPEIEQKVYFSPGTDCLDEIIHQLNQCYQSVDICVFTISDNRISRAIKACHQRRVRVRVITDNDKMWDKGSDIKELAQAGLDVRIDQSPHHMHNKFALFDGKCALTGSYNWTRSAATSNEENLVVSNDPNLIRAFQGEFESLWKSTSPV